ncbi:hypothetical protein BUE80_DR008046 [Diplocarpon rosae]|nr:hypothetical protein BUE80_DR008046 [Diplocarpon rosae]
MAERTCEFADPTPSRFAAREIERPTSPAPSSRLSSASPRPPEDTGPAMQEEGKIGAPASGDRGLHSPPCETAAGKEVASGLTQALGSDEEDAFANSGSVLREWVHRFAAALSSQSSQALPRHPRPRYLPQRNLPLTPKPPAQHAPAAAVPVCEKAYATKEKAAEDGMERGEETVEERIEEREEEREEEKREWEVDIIISNPPYISQRAFDTETTRSVRNWEPRLALLPSVASTRTGVDQHAGNGAEKVCKRIGNVDLEDEDIFFVRLMAIHDLRNSKVCVMEVGDEEQAERVVALYNHLPLARHNSIEFWRDHPSSPPAPGDEIIKFHKPGGHLVPFPVRGAGKIRAVVILRDEFMPRHRHARERYPAGGHAATRESGQGSLAFLVWSAAVNTLSRDINIGFFATWLAVSKPNQAPEQH